MNLFNENNNTPEQSPDHNQSGEMWNSWSTGRILGLAIMLVVGNFLSQILLYGSGGGLFLPVLAGSVIGVFLPLVVVIRQNGLCPDKDFGLNNPGPLVLLASAAVAIAALVPTSLLAELSMRLHPVDQSWVNLFQENLPDTTVEYIVAFVAVVLAAPLAEEIIFRGLIHRLVSRIWGAGAAIIISSMVFALIHGEPWFLLGLLGVGLALAIVYESTGSITACWVTHAVHNGLSLGIMLTTKEVVAETSPISWQDWALCGLSLMSLFGIWQWLRKKSTSSSAAAPDQN